jgi:NADPH:quinone reductase-like Zn-dependent oxidoreductase
MRQGFIPNKAKLPLPIVPGIDVVGRVHQVNAETSQRYGLKVGDRVISLVKSGGNARYLTINAIQATMVPDSVNPVETVCLAETYLAAFQILHIGQAQRIRYREDSLKGKTILLKGFGISATGQAVVQLASQAGATNVFSLAERNHFDYLASIGISPIGTDMTDWKKDMAGTIDFVISSDDDFADVPFKILKSNGHAIIWKGTSKRGSKESSLKLKKGFLSCFKSIAVQNRISLYNVYDEWEKNLDGCKLDLQHLIYLIEKRKVEPKVLDRVSLGNVAQAQELVASKQIKGFIVCEPWLLDKSKTICL